MCVLCYLLCIYKYTHCIYLRKMLCLYSKYIYVI